MKSGSPDIFERSRDLVLYLTYTNLRVESSRYYLNFLWWIIDPLLMLATYYILFGLIIQHSVPDFIPFLLVGLVCWQWFSNSVSHAMGSVLSSGMLIRQVYFPKLVLPVSVLLVDFVKILVVIAVLLVFVWSYGFAPGVHYLALPLVMMVQAVLIYGVAVMMAGLVPLLPDLRLIVLALLQLSFFLSGVLFQPTDVPEQFLWLFYLNPMAPIIEAWRAILLYAAWPHWGNLGQALVIGVACSLAGNLLFRQLDPVFPNIVEEG